MNKYSTRYTSMLNLLKILKQLDQYALPILCDKGVFRILVQILGGFHVAKCVENCIKKCIQGSGIEGSV